MIRNYLKIAIRQLRKQKMYAAVKIGGFALGIAACLLIALYIRDETSFDKSYPNLDRIYRLTGFFAHDGKVEKDVSWPAPMSKAILSDIPEVELCGRMMPNSLIGHAGADELRPVEQVQNTYEKGFAYIDQSTLDIFQLPMVYGKRESALKEPYTMVITKSIADKYYPGQNPIGKVMVLDNDKNHAYRVGGVIADIPSNSHLHPYNFFLTLSHMEFWNGEQNNWGDINYPIYLKIRAGTNAAQLQEKLSHDMLYNYFLPSMKKGGQVDAEKLISEFSIHLQPVKDINLYSYDIQDGLSHGDVRFTWLFGAIAAFILVIACINFINLSTAKSANRAKEVGLRKVVGSYRSSLINQFLTESVIYSIISFIAGIFIAWLVLPYFNALANKSLVMPWEEWWFAPAMLVSALIVGIFAGLYPAFYLSSFKPIQVLKGSISGGSKSPLLRNGLVVFQFTASIILIICTIVIYNQTHFILNRKVGFDKDQVMVLQGTNTMGDLNVESFKTKLSRIASVKSVSISDYLPISGSKRNGNTFFKEGREKLDAGVGGQFWQIDDTYLKTLGMKLVEGRNFSYNMSSDTAGKSIIINQTLAKKLGLTKPVGARITNGGLFTVIGVVQDFNFESMRGDIEPLVLHFGISPSLMTIKFRGGDVQNTIANVSALWKKYSPDQPVRYTFLDQEFANMYSDVQRTGGIFTSFAVLAIIIACLGLFALSAFMAEQRSREIGIRKVLGASVQGITSMLSMDFVKLVLLAIVIASPVAGWGLNKMFLQDFAYKAPINWYWICGLAGLAAILIALVTVSFQSIKAALANPIKSLRSE